jgi:GNAT superfamily N-acetyltransferase
MHDAAVGAVDPVRIVPLTQDVADAAAAAAARALTGDCGCSAANMRTSCFAAERCATTRGAGPIAPMDLAALCAEPHAFVALAADDAFAGCVTAAPAAPCAREFPACAFGADDLLLSHLCVAEAQRGAAVGRRLVARVLAAAPPGAATYLRVDRRGLLPGANADVRAAFEARVARLRATYDRLEFDPAGQSADFLLMRHRRRAA